MNPSVLGTAIGVGIALAMVALVAWRQVSSHQARASAKYPDPDWHGFYRLALPMIGFLVLLHWLPDIAVWSYATFLHQSLFIDGRKYDFVLIVGHTLAMIGVTTLLLGNIWSAWHKQRHHEH